MADQDQIRIGLPSERASASELIITTNNQQTPIPQQEVYRVSEQSERTQTTTTTMKQLITHLLERLEDDHQHHDDLFDMWTHGPRDERLSWIRPDQQDVLSAERRIKLTMDKLAIIGYAPCELPSIDSFNAYVREQDKSAPF